MQGLVVFSIDVAQRRVQIVHGAEQLSKWTGGVLPRDVSELQRLVHTADPAELERCLDDAIRTRGAFECEVRVGREEEPWLWLTGAFADEPQPRLLGTGLDITQRRRREAALTLSEAKLRAVLDIAQDAIVSVDERGLIESVNEAAATMFRCAPADMVGARWQTFLAGECCRRRDGSVFPAACGVTAIEREGARSLLCVVRDLSEQRAVERRVLDARADLRRRIGQDLHESLGQLLTGTAFLAKGLESNVEVSYRPQARRVVELINKAITRVRGLADGLSQR